MTNLFFQKQLYLNHLSVLQKGNIDLFLRCSSLKISPTSDLALTLKTGRREVPGSNPGRIYRPSRSEFSVVFSETT